MFIVILIVFYGFQKFSACSTSMPACVRIFVSFSILSLWCQSEVDVALFGLCVYLSQLFVLSFCVVVFVMFFPHVFLILFALFPSSVFLALWHAARRAQCVIVWGDHVFGCCDSWLSVVGVGGGRLTLISFIFLISV